VSCIWGSKDVTESSGVRHVLCNERYLVNWVVIQAVLQDRKGGLLIQSLCNITTTYKVKIRSIITKQDCHCIWRYELTFVCSWKFTKFQTEATELKRRIFYIVFNLLVVFFWVVIPWVMWVVTKALEELLSGLKMEATNLSEMLVTTFCCCCYSCRCEIMSELWPPMCLLFIPQIYEYGERLVNDTDMGKPKNSEKSLSQCHCVPHKSHMDWPGHEPSPAQWDWWLKTWAMAQPLVTTHKTTWCHYP
jgi:hypothetical protein